jgi:hypothetical protein
MELRITVSRRYSLPRSQPPEDLEPDEKRKLKQWVASHYPALLPRLRELVDACLDYHRAHGNLMADWTACCRTWIRNTGEWSGQRPRYREPARGTRERPQELRPETKTKPVSIAQLLRMDTEGEA